MHIIDNGAEAEARAGAELCFSLNQSASSH